MQLYHKGQRRAQRVSKEYKKTERDRLTSMINMDRYRSFNSRYRRSGSQEHSGKGQFYSESSTLSHSDKDADNHLSSHLLIRHALPLMLLARKWNIHL
jgi:hypothetical protein